MVENPDTDGDGLLSSEEILDYVKRFSPKRLYRAMDQYGLQPAGRGAQQTLDTVTEEFVNLWKLLPRSLKRLAVLGTAGTGALVAFAKDPFGFMIDIIDRFIFQFLLLPLGHAIFIAMREFLRTLAVLVYGTNYKIGLGGPVGGEPASQPGLLDLPFVISRPIAGVNLDIFATLTGTIQDLIRTAAVPIAEQTGFAAPIVTSAFWAVVLFGGAWVLWVIARSIDIPIIQPTDTLLAVTAPIRRIIDRWL